MMNSLKNSIIIGKKISVTKKKKKMKKKISQKGEKNG